MVPLDLMAAGFTITQGIIDLVDRLRAIGGSDVLSAYFDSEGKRIHGSEKVVVQVIKSQTESTIWWYTIIPQEGYEFIRFPVINAIELCGTRTDETNPDAKYWRWVSNAEPGRLFTDLPATLRVNFVVVGYKPKALIDHFRS